MKRRASRILSLALTLVLLFPLLCHTSEAAGVSLSGSNALHPGEKITLTFSAGGSSIYAMQASLHYDSSKLTLLGTSCLLDSSWRMDMNGSTLVLSDSQLSHPINSTKPVFSVTFRLKESVDAGQSVSASVENVTVSDGNSDTSLGSATWQAKVTSPLSGNAALKKLTCDNATLSPAFSADNTSYRATVPYDVTALTLHYQTDHASASATVSGNSLSVGANTVTVQVTAQDGSTRRYTIAVTREEDPSYVASHDATLAKLKTSSGRLSPAFSPDVTSYVIYVPYEVTDITLSGTAHDGKARSVTDAEATLQEGDNILSVCCTAEDGVTVETYQVHVWRMPLYSGTLPEIISPTAAPVTPPAEDTAPDSTQSHSLKELLCAAIALPLLGDVPLYVLLAIVLLLLLALYLLGCLTGSRRSKRKLLALQQSYEDFYELPVTMKEPVEQPVEEVATAEETAVQAQQSPTLTPEEMSIDDLLSDIRNM